MNLNDLGMHSISSLANSTVSCVVQDIKVSANHVWLVLLLDGSVVHETCIFSPNKNFTYEWHKVFATITGLNNFSDAASEMKDKAIPCHVFINKAGLVSRPAVPKAE